MYREQFCFGNDFVGNSSFGLSQIDNQFDPGSHSLSLESSDCSSITSPSAAGSVSSLFQKV